MSEAPDSPRHGQDILQIVVGLVSTVTFLSAAVGAAGARTGQLVFRKLRRKTGPGAAIGSFTSVLLIAWIWISLASTYPGSESLFQKTWGAYALFLATSGSLAAWLNNYEEDSTESPAAVFATLIVLSPCIVFPLMMLTLV